MPNELEEEYYKAEVGKQELKVKKISELKKRLNKLLKKKIKEKLKSKKGILSHIKIAKGVSAEQRYKATSKLIKAMAEKKVGNPLSVGSHYYNQGNKQTYMR